MLYEVRLLFLLRGSTSSASLLTIATELNKEPIEGFCVELTEDEDLFRWKIYLEGPQDSP